MADVIVCPSPHLTPLLCAMCELAFVGGSLQPGAESHQLLDVAVAGCAVMVGPHYHVCSRLVEDLNTCAVNAAEEVSL